MVLSIRFSFFYFFFFFFFSFLLFFYFLFFGSSKYWKKCPCGFDNFFFFWLTMWVWQHCNSTFWNDNKLFFRLNHDCYSHDLISLPWFCNVRISFSGFVARIYTTTSNAYVGKQLCFRTDFPKLTKLEIHNSPQLNEIIIEMGVTPNMKSLYINSCMELKTVRKGIEYLKNLQQLYLESVSMELQNSIEGEGSVGFPKEQHIPNILIW